MEFRPIVLGIFLLILLYVITNPPGSGGGKHDDHKDKDKGKKRH